MRVLLIIDIGEATGIYVPPAPEITSLCKNAVIERIIRDNSLSQRHVRDIKQHAELAKTAHQMVKVEGSLGVEKPAEDIPTSRR